MLNNDHDIVEALLRRDEQITREFFYRKCYPLFKSVYDNYHTDCASCMEFINEIYILVLSPDHTTGKCKLDGFLLSEHAIHVVEDRLSVSLLQEVRGEETDNKNADC